MVKKRSEVKYKVRPALIIEKFASDVFNDLDFALDMDSNLALLIGDRKHIWTVKTVISKGLLKYLAKTGATLQ